MADRKPFLLRIERPVLDAVQRWANDDLRSLNGQIEFLLRDALRRAGRPVGRDAAVSDGRENSDDEDHDDDRDDDRPRDTRSSP